MPRVNDDIYMGVGHISHESTLGPYYQDISKALPNVTNGKFAVLDSFGIPCFHLNGNKVYCPITVIQYGLMCNDLILKYKDNNVRYNHLKNIVAYLENTKEYFNDSILWKNKAYEAYNLKDGWISCIIQGQALSLYLRLYQLFDDSFYFDRAIQIYNSFNIPFEDGGFRRYDIDGNLWYEEYPSEPPSYVLNGFVYAILGIYDFYRVTHDQEVLENWNQSLQTLQLNLHKYDVWYWSLYDQLKKELVSFYYMKNIHIPLMEIMFQLTGINIFSHYAEKWKKNYNNIFHRNLAVVMYRIKHRL